MRSLSYEDWREKVDWTFCPYCGAPTDTPSPSTGYVKSGVRDQVFEVVVRQALAGAPWQEICAGPMQANNIRPADVEAEVNRRKISQAGAANNQSRVGLLGAAILLLTILLVLAYYLANSGK